MRPINCGFRSLKGKASFVNPVNELFSLGYKVQHNLVPRVLSYPPYGARERETLENAGHMTPEQNYF